MGIRCVFLSVLNLVHLPLRRGGNSMRLGCYGVVSGFPWRGIFGRGSSLSLGPLRISSASLSGHCVAGGVWPPLRLCGYPTQPLLPEAFKIRIKIRPLLFEDISAPASTSEALASTFAACRECRRASAQIGKSPFRLAACLMPF